MSEEMRAERVKLSKKQAKKIYNTGGYIYVDYVFVNDSGKCISKNTSFLFTDCGRDWEGIQSIFRVGGVRDVSYYTDNDSYNASSMCDLMCN